MKRNRFLIGSAVLLLLVLLGGVYKHTVLGEQRVVLSYPYQMKYTVEIPDVDAEIAEMYFKGMGLYLDEETSAGTVSAVKTQGGSIRSGGSGGCHPDGQRFWPAAEQRKPGQLYPEQGELLPFYQPLYRV